MKKVEPHAHREGYSETLKHHTHTIAVVAHKKQHEADGDTIVNIVLDVVDIYNRHREKKEKKEEIHKAKARYLLVAHNQCEHDKKTCNNHCKHYIRQQLHLQRRQRERHEHYKEEYHDSRHERHIMQIDTSRNLIEI